MKRYILGITGASGSIFGLRVLSELVKSAHVFVTVSSNALPIIMDETGLSLEHDTETVLRDYAKSDNLDYFADSDFYAPIASGSFKIDGMLVVPCSMKTLSSIAVGSASNLIERAADVTIKEGRKLLLSPREMPFSAVHLENMLKLARLGVRIAPPLPAFYHNPETLDDMVDFVTGKILDGMGIENELFKRWKSD